MDCHDETVIRGYRRILGRDPDPSGGATYAALLRSGAMKEDAFLRSLLDSPEFKQKNPPLCGGGGNPPPPPPPPGGGAITSLTLSANHRGFLLNGRPWTIASHGNIVPAISQPNRDWRTDIALQVSKGESYARLWHILADHTTEWPWVKVGGKWDLSQLNPVYWDLMRTILTEATGKGIVVEPHIFDRCCGGSQQDYKAYPWHPSNNVNGVELPSEGPGFPPFYEAPPSSKLFQLQAGYVRKWAELCADFPGTILEIENEKREGNNVGWVRQWAKLIKSVNPKQLVSHSDIDRGHLDAIYSIPEVDIINVHFGDEGNSSRTLHSYIATHWNKGKAINIDEFANRLGNKALLREMCETITRNGAHFHIEDSLPEADGYGAAAASRSLAVAANPPYYEVGPVGPAPPCPKESKRGWSMLYINDKNNQRAFTGNTACTKASAAGQIRVGYTIQFDSTALVGTQDPVPKGCGDCEENPTVWSHTLQGVGKQDGECGYEIKLTGAGVGTVTAKPMAGPGAAVTKTIKVVP